MNERYRNQVRLLLDVLPELAKLPQFALKGGTALNFFWHNLPRLSVDIDLVYLPVKERTDSLREIENGLTILTDRIKQNITGVSIQQIDSGGVSSRLVIRTSNALIKLRLIPRFAVRSLIYTKENYATRCRSCFRNIQLIEPSPMKIFMEESCVPLSIANTQETYLTCTNY